MKFNADFVANIWFRNVEIEASSKEEAKGILMGMTVDELLDLGYTDEAEIKDLDLIETEATYNIKVYGVTYVPATDEFGDPAVDVDELNLPTEVELTIEDFDAYHGDLDAAIEEELKEVLLSYVDYDIDLFEGDYELVCSHYDIVNKY